MRYSISMYVCMYVCMYIRYMSCYPVEEKYDRRDRQRGQTK